jgi:hypothetical protein
MWRRTWKLNEKPRWRRLCPRWKPSLPTGDSAGAGRLWCQRKPIFAHARSGRAETTRARAEAGSVQECCAADSIYSFRCSVAPMFEGAFTGIIAGTTGT